MRGIDLADVAGIGTGPVLEDEVPVCDVEDLLKPVRDKDHSHPALPQRPDRGHQRVDVRSSEHRRRLVEHEDAHAAMQGLGDFEDLLLGDAQARDRPIGVQVDVHLGEGADGLAAGGAPVDQPAALAVAAEHQVLGDRQRRKQVELLVDGDDAQALGVCRRGDANRLTVQQDRPGIGLLRARQDLDERRLARPVLADEREDLSRPHVQADVIERTHAGKRLGDVTHLEHWTLGSPRCRRIGHRPSPFGATPAHAGSRSWSSGMTRGSLPGTNVQSGRWSFSPPRSADSCDRIPAQVMLAAWTALG